MYIFSRYQRRIMAKRAQRSKVAKWGNSLAVRIPQDAAQELGLSEGSDVSVSIKGKALTIRRMRRTITLDELLDGVTPKNSGGEIDAGPAVGREAW
jgi:antitoxin MazE